MIFKPLLGLSSARYFKRHPWQFGLTLLGIALGVSVVTAVELASQSARRAFELSSEAVLGRTTHQIVGGTLGIPERVYVQLRMNIGYLPAAPIVEAPVRTDGADRVSLTLLGVDPLAEPEFRGHLGIASKRRAQAKLITEPMTAALSDSTAARLGLEPGDVLALNINGRRVELEIALLLAPRTALERQGLENVVLTDIATAQDILDNAGYLTRIDLIVSDPGGGSGVLDRLRALIPSGARLVETGPRTRATAQMTRAFDLNLYMLGLLALVVGMFLIFNAMSFSVVQRRALIGRLRVLGTTRREVFFLVLMEAAVFGLAGAVLGLIIGALLAQQLLGLMAQTINDLYYSVQVSEVSLSPAILFKSLLLGIGGALVAAVLPAIEAAHAPPRLALQRHELERRGRKLLPLVSAGGVALLLFSLAAVFWPGGGLGAAFAALFFMVFGFALLAPGAMVVAMRLLSPIAASVGGDIASLALRGVGRHMSRTGVAVAALMVAVAATAGVAVMVDSFRHSVSDWLGRTLRADIYMSVPGVGNLRSISPETIQRVRNTDGVSNLSLGRRLTLESETGEVEALAIEMAEQSYAGFKIISENPEQAWAAFDEENAVLVSEPIALRSGIAVGGGVTLLTEKGLLPFKVAGIFRDYSTDRGLVLMSRATFVSYWMDEGITTIGVYVLPGTDLAELRSRLEAAAGDQALFINDAASIRELSMEVFDRTFTITNVLRLLAVIIAFVGILSALMAIQLELGREFAVLRALGLTRAQLFGIAEAQTGVLGLVAGLLALPLGVLLSLMLVEVINRRSFGWSMSFEVDPALLGNALALSLCAALLAGLYPAYRIATTSPAEVLREE
ncbi:MAG: FtsX-like permease family protein [Gammaproteobacteria bacterium]|nr:FtsX-like permease family protein [Gammaproteobacteria bacterium]